MGDSKAFTFIYKKLYPSVYYFSKRFVGEETAKDIASDAFAKLWTIERNFQTLQSIKLFLQVCTRNASINYNERLKTATKNRDNIAALHNLKTDIFNEEEEIKAELIVGWMFYVNNRNV